MIRHADPTEIAEFARQWARCMLSETRPVDDLGPFVQLGPKRGHGLHQKFLLQAMSLATRAALDDEDAFVSVLESEDVPLAWCCWVAPHDRPLTIKFLHVADLVRRRGFGSTLLRHVLGHRDGRPVKLTCITSSGAALYRAVAAPARVTDEHAAAAHSRVVEARGI